MLDWTFSENPIESKSYFSPERRVAIVAALKNRVQTNSQQTFSRLPM
jgi:hypothetical protein